MKYRAAVLLWMLPVFPVLAQPGDAAPAHAGAPPPLTAAPPASPAADAQNAAGAAAAPGEPAPAAEFSLQRAEIAAFVREVSARNDLDAREVRTLLRNAQPQPKIIEIMNRPVEKIAPWWEYRARFLTSERINDGVQFWQEHRQSVERASAAYQVPPEYLVAILGVETFYGRITGRYRVLDVLATLAFNYPPRARYFRGELEQYLLLVKENRLDPRATLGSYAGAMGVPQFMPSTYRRYGIDAGKRHQSDLWNDWDDILGSVANYLHEHGWRPGAPVLCEARLDAEPNFQIDPRNVELNETVAGLARRGVRVTLEVPADTRAVLISAEQREGPAYRVGFHNFWVITRYNTSARYAMAVHDLAQAISQRVAATAIATPAGPAPKSGTEAVPVAAHAQ